MCVCVYTYKYDIYIDTQLPKSPKPYGETQKGPLGRWGKTPSTQIDPAPKSLPPPTLMAPIDVGAKDV